MKLGAFEKSKYNHTSTILRHKVQGQILNVLKIKELNIFLANCSQGLQEKLTLKSVQKDFSLGTA